MVAQIFPTFISLTYIMAGHHTWAKNFPMASGQNQSPINIDPRKAQYDPEMKTDLKWVQTRNKGTKLQNNGHGFRVYLESDIGIPS